MTRPYIGKTIVELEAIFAARKADQNELKRLSEELKHRNVPRAVNLLAKVKAAKDGSNAEQESPKQEANAARPYIGKTIVELEALFAAGAADRDTLQRLSQELTHRKVPKAVNLLARIRAAIKTPGSHQEPPSQDHAARKKAAPSSEEPTHKTVPCKACGQVLRVPLTTGTFSCPSCKTKFKATFDDGVFSLVFANPTTENPQAKDLDDKPMTLDDAYALFEANDATPWETIEGKRRKLLQQYHPDKVASLGPKLRALAEVEGKRINVAYRMVQQARGY